MSTLTLRERVWRHQYSEPVLLECGYDFAGSEAAVKSRQLQRCVVNIQHTCAIALLYFFLMAAVLCIACGADTGPKSRVNFSAGSKRALEPRERVLSTLKELLTIEREKRQIQGVCNPSTESVKMCRTCFGRYEKCYNLKSELLENLHLAYDKISPLLGDEPLSDAPVSDENPHPHQMTPTRKRSSDSKKPPTKRVCNDSSFSLASAADSPPVTVSRVKLAL